MMNVQGTRWTSTFHLTGRHGNGDTFFRHPHWQVTLLVPSTNATFEYPSPSTMGTELGSMSKT